MEVGWPGVEERSTPTQATAEEQASATATQNREDLYKRVINIAPVFSVATHQSIATGRYWCRSNSVATCLQEPAGTRWMTPAKKCRSASSVLRNARWSHGSVSRVKSATSELSSSAARVPPIAVAA